MSVTYKTLITEGRNTLHAAGVISYLLDGRVLLEHASGYSYGYIFSHYDDVVSKDVVALYQSFIQRRAAYEPVSKIVGHKEFWGLDFKTTRATLDPRPESETLIEAVLQFYPETLESLDFLELGVGTGCLLLTLLHLYTRSFGLGIDVSLEALEVAKDNAEHLKLLDRVTFMQSSWFEAVPSKTFDVILSNPPYIALKDKDSLGMDVKNYDPHLALFGGDDGLDPYRLLFKKVKNFLKPEGLFIVEHGMGQEQALEVMGRDVGFQDIQRFKDLAGISRVMALRL